MKKQVNWKWKCILWVLLCFVLVSPKQYITGSYDPADFEVDANDKFFSIDNNCTRDCGMSYMPPFYLPPTFAKIIANSYPSTDTGGNLIIHS